jgi:hypothetical protein
VVDGILQAIKVGGTMKLMLGMRLAVASAIAVGGLTIAHAVSPQQAEAARVCAEVHRTQNGSLVPIVPWTCVGSSAAPTDITITDDIGPILGIGVGYTVTADTE